MSAAGRVRPERGSASDQSSGRKAFSLPAKPKASLAKPRCSGAGVPGSVRKPTVGRRPPFFSSLFHTLGQHSRMNTMGPGEPAGTGYPYSAALPTGWARRATRRRIRARASMRITASRSISNASNPLWAKYRHRGAMEPQRAAEPAPAGPSSPSGREAPTTKPWPQPMAGRSRRGQASWPGRYARCDRRGREPPVSRWGTMLPAREEGYARRAGVHDRASTPTRSARPAWRSPGDLIGRRAQRNHLRLMRLLRRHILRGLLTWSSWTFPLATPTSFTNWEFATPCARSGRS